MQGQDSTSNANQGTFYLDYQSNGISLRWDQNNVVPADTFVHNNHPVIGWMGQSSSSVNNQNPVRFQDLLAEDGLVFNGVDQSTSNMNIQTPVRFQDLLAEDGLHSSSVGVGTNQSLEERHSRPIIAPFPYSVNTSLGNSQLTNRQLSLQQANCSVLPQSIDLNAASNSHNIDASLNMATGLCSSPFKLSGSDANQNAFANDPSNSNSLVISSGIAGYVLEENEGGEGRSSVGRRLSCKRRAPEDASRQLSSFGESSRQAQKFVNTRENATRRLNLSTSTNNQLNVRNSEQLCTGPVVGLGAAPVMHQPSSTAASGLQVGAGAEAEPFQRNIRLRRTVNQQDFLPANLVASNTRNSYAQLPGQPAVIFPFNCVPNTGLPTGIIHPTPPIQQLVHVPPEFQRRNLEHFLTNPNFFPGTNFPRNIASSSRNSSNSRFHQSSPSIWFPQGYMAQQYAQGILDTVNHTEYQRQGSYWPQHSGLSIGTRERELSAISGNARPYQIPLRSGFTAQVERQTGAHPEVALHSLIAAQRRSRLVSEVRNALALVRRGSSLQLEDVMVIDRSVLYGVPEEPDMHEDMRLDVDNLSYEELLALEERIGNVCTGLSEDAILTHMKRQKYEAIAMGSPLKDEPCCICQEDYAEGEDLGKLDCGHDFHFNCIKQWLVQKNNCPICKMIGLEF